MRSANGLRHPAYASCLGWHLRLAGRCPNNSSLFPPLAAVVVVALRINSGKNIFICSSETPAEFGGAKPLHLLTQTTPLLESPTGAFIAAQPQPFRNCFFTGRGAYCCLTVSNIKPPPLGEVASRSDDGEGSLPSRCKKNKSGNPQAARLWSDDLFSVAAYSSTSPLSKNARPNAPGPAWVPMTQPICRTSGSGRSRVSRK